MFPGEFKMCLPSFQILNLTIKRINQMKIVKSYLFYFLPSGLIILTAPFLIIKFRVNNKLCVLKTKY